MNTINQLEEAKDYVTHCISEGIISPEDIADMGNDEFVTFAYNLMDNNDLFQDREDREYNQAKEDIYG